MQSSFLLSLLAAAGAIAAPARHHGSAKPPVRVILQDQATETGSQTQLPFGRRAESRPVGSSGPFSTVELKVGGHSEQSLRCKILDNKGQPIIVTRGANVDTTFSDAGKGPWSFPPTEVIDIICDPSFKAAPVAPPATQPPVRVVLQDQASELGTQTELPFGLRTVSKPVGGSGPFSTVELNVGDDSEQSLRCQILDNNGHPIVVTRGANVDTTFSDAGKGPWSFTKTEVSDIICDPAFKAAPAPVSTSTSASTSAPTGAPSAKPPVRVVLQDQASELGTQTELPFGRRVESKPVGGSGPFSTVELNVGDATEQSLRCQILDNRGAPITVTRGANVDTTFSDAGKGPWSFTKTEVSDIICDPAFKAAPAPVSTSTSASTSAPTGAPSTKPPVRVVLQDQASEIGGQTELPFGRRVESKPVGGSGPFSTVELNVGDATEQSLRCQILDNRGAPITVTRGANVDTTFSDAGKGPWSFTKTDVSDIICDPAFKAAPISAPTSGAPTAKPPVRVVLQDQASEIGGQTELPFGQRVESKPVGGSGPYSTVELNVGDDTEQALRCQILDNRGAPITVTRGANVDTTFSDAGKGPWSFTKTDVSDIICDPSFKSVN